MLQDEEIAFWTGRYAARREFRVVVEAEDVVEVVRANFARRVRWVDGDAEVVPGVSVHHVGGHTPGMQVVFWNVTDPDGDNVTSTFAIRRDGETNWTDLAVNTHDNFAQFDTAHLPDEGISWNYTTWLNIVSLVLAAALVVRFVRSGGGPMLAMMGGDPDTDHQDHAHH